jgi:hypothetical protein
MVTAPEPEPQWHFTASRRQAEDRVRIAAVMLSHRAGEAPACDIATDAAGNMKVRVSQEEGALSIRLALRPSTDRAAPLGTVRYTPESGPGVTLRIETEPGMTP